MNINIDTTQVSNIATNINKRRVEISEIYHNKILPILKTSEDCLKVSGLSYDEVVTSFNTVFDSLNEKLNNLTDDLNTKVIPQYESSATVVSRMFNDEFADKVREAMAIMNQN